MSAPTGPHLAHPDLPGTRPRFGQGATQNPRGQTAVWLGLSFPRWPCDWGLWPESVG